MHAEDDRGSIDIVTVGTLERAAQDELRTEAVADEQCEESEEYETVSVVVVVGVVASGIVNQRERFSACCKELFQFHV